MAKIRGQVRVDLHELAIDWLFISPSEGQREDIKVAQFPSRALMDWLRSHPQCSVRDTLGIVAGGSLLTELITVQPLKVCRAFTTKDIKEHLGKFSPHKQHSPALAICALQQTLDAHDETRKINRQVTVL